MKKIIYMILFAGCLLLCSACSETNSENESGDKIFSDSTKENNEIREETEEIEKKDLDRQEKTDFVADTVMSIDVANRKIFIPENHIMQIQKNTCEKNEAIEDANSINKICEVINEAEMATIMLNNTELSGGKIDGTLEQYPFLLQSRNENEYFSIEGIKTDGEDYYTLLRIVIPKENLNYNSEEIQISFSDEKAYIICNIESEKLYYAVKELWGRRLSLDDLRESCKIKIYYNENSILGKEKGIENSIEFSEDDCKVFIENLKKEAYIVNDDHVFGVSMEITLETGEVITVCYAEDGCAMFQLDGVCYHLESTDKSAEIAEKYIKILEDKVDE